MAWWGMGLAGCSDVSRHQTRRMMTITDPMDKRSTQDAGLNLQPEVGSQENHVFRDTICPVTVRGMREGLVSAGIHVVFIISGISALIYQLVWQRALLMLYGSNTESVAMVVAAFMIGLGLGSIAGGRASNRKGAPLVLLFSGTELFIGLYGAISLRLFHWVGGFT